MRRRAVQAVAVAAWLAGCSATVTDGGAAGSQTTTTATTTTATTTVDTTTPTRVAPATTAGTTTNAPSTTTITTIATTAPPAPPVLQTSAATPDWAAIAAALGEVQLPTDCPLPLGQPGLLPNSDRSYRGGTHEGVDFVCMEYGHTAVAALPGRVVMVVDSYTEPTKADRDRLLEEAQQLGETPPYTLQFLFGRFVVLDHGNVAGVGHVLTIYAHLAAVDPAVQPGVALPAGAVIGMIGNSGTETAATGGTRPQSIHLHWELHVDDLHFPAGLDEQQTSAAVALLFGS